MRKNWFGVVCALAVLSVLEHPALALDKQGSAHGGQVGGDEKEFNVSGSGTLGASLYNPSYAARPDNTGLALFRYALHIDVDLLGRMLSIPIDVNLFTDRQRHGLAVFAPSELDLIGGVTSTNDLTKGFDLELGARVEHDAPVDQGNYTQTYVDARARLLYSVAEISPSFGQRLVDGDLSGYATLGWFAVNPSYAARPDNTGRALFRYVAHSELAVWRHQLAVGADATFFTDRRASDPIRPSELDFTPEVIGRYDGLELHLAYERDMPLDTGGLVQHFLYLLVAGSFDFHDQLHPPPPATPLARQ